MLYDIDMPVRVQFDRQPAVEKSLTRRTWQAWPLPVPGQPATFVIGAGAIPLVRGTLGNGTDALSGAQRIHP